MSLYFRVLLPIIGRVVTTSPQTKKLWLYYWETIDQCVSPNVVMEAMRSVGFKDVGRNVSLGLFSEFTAAKPA